MKRYEVKYSIMNSIMNGMVKTQTVSEDFLKKMQNNPRITIYYYKELKGHKMKRYYNYHKLIRWHEKYFGDAKKNSLWINPKFHGVEIVNNKMYGVDKYGNDVEYTIVDEWTSKRKLKPII